MRSLRKLTRAFALAAFLVAAVPAWAAAGTDDVRLAPAGKARFPDRSFTLTLPKGASLGPAQVRVTENARAVTGLSVTPAEATRGQFGFVLVIDSSKSMEGKPIKGALSAAAAFAKHRYPDQKLGVVTFNSSAVTALPLTTDQSAIDSFLATTPALDYGTRVYEAVEQALGLLQKGGVTAGSIVVLSDGADTGSTATAEQVAAKARAAGIRIFTVGLRSRSFDGRALAALAKSAHGHYATAGTARELNRIYDQLGAVLANEFLLRYRSLAGPDAKVAVKVEVDGYSTASSDYVTPPLPAVKADSSDSASRSFWASSAATVLIAVVFALLLALAILGVLSLRPRGRGLRERLEAFVATPPAEDEEQSARRRGLTGRVFTGAERSLEHMRWWAQFKEELEIARVRMAPVHVVLWTAVGTLFALWLLGKMTGSVLLAMPAFGIPFAVRAVIKKKLAKQRTLFSDQLADNLLVVASAMRAGHSFAGALSVAGEDAPEPARAEFKRVIADEKLGVSIERGLDVVAKRMDNRDLEQVVLVAGLHRETGGDSAEVLELVATTVRERGELRRTVDTLTAQGRLSRWIVSSLPVGLMLFITAINPGYMEPLFKTGIGNAMLVLAAIMLTIGSLVIKRIVNIKV
jgi:tight adherence protein B